MTSSPIVWRLHDPGLAASTCHYAGCPAAPAVMRRSFCGRAEPRWRSYCSAHASLYGVWVGRPRAR